MTRVASILCIVSLFAAVPVAESLAAPAGGDAGASAKKKKCAKGKVRQKVKKNGKTVKKNGKAVYKCVKKNTGGGGGGTGGGGGGGTTTPTDPKAVFTSLVSGQQFYRPFATVNISGEEFWRFCTDGRYYRRYTSSSSALTTEYQDKGTWTITQAQASPQVPGAYVGVLALVGTFDGEQKSGNIAIGASPSTAQSVIDYGTGEKEFTRGVAPGPC